jgi:radical SAM superfamily enzyme YgiQ (UPF0313 family)
MKIALVAFGNEESYGLLMVAGELLRSRQEIRFFDAEEAGVVDRICSWSPDFAFFSPMTTFFPQALSVSRKVKDWLPDVVSVFGGHHATAAPEIAKAPGVDIVIVGPIRGTLEAILTKKPGVLYGEVTTPADLPLPARKEYYRDIPRMADRYRKIMLSRLGCPWTCSYCASSLTSRQEIFGAEAHKRYFLARRPLAAIIEEAR